MKLEVGQVIRVKKKKENKGYFMYGRISEIHENYMLIQLENYKECILKADILDRDNHDISVKVEGRFVQVNIDMYGV